MYLYYNIIISIYLRFFTSAILSILDVVCKVYLILYLLESLEIPI